VSEAAVRAIREGRARYTHSLGILPLREAIAEDAAREYGVAVPPERIIVTAGTSPAMVLVFAALLDPGDEVIMADPHYACHPTLVATAGGHPVLVPTAEADGFQLDPDAVRRRITPRTKAILVNSPANPTGCLLDGERMAALAALGPPVVSDEIYHGLVAGERARSILEFTDRGFVLNGFSKKYAMTGWRLGYAIAPRPFMRPIQKLQQNLFISAGEVAQWAGLAALREGRADAARMAAAFDARRRALVPALRDLGLGIAVEPRGAFYVLANARHVDPDSRRLAFDILEKAHVALTPGVDFGEGAEGYLRFSCASAEHRIAEGVRRLGAYLRRSR
jgi:aspartate/methionine/tyrosine aminotransferase